VFMTTDTTSWNRVRRRLTTAAGPLLLPVLLNLLPRPLLPKHLKIVVVVFMVIVLGAKYGLLAVIDIPRNVYAGPPMAARLELGKERRVMMRATALTFLIVFQCGSGL